MPQDNAIPRRLVKVQDAARYLAICERKLWELEKEGKITAVKIDRSVRFAIEDLDAFIQQCKGPSVASEASIKRPTFQCMDCFYWVEIDRHGQNKDRTGGCKRYPPKFKKLGESIAMETCFITTKGRDWCGEFKLR